LLLLSVNVIAVQTVNKTLSAVKVSAHSSSV